MKIIRKYASFANVTSLMALMVALGGTAYAGVSLARNSVGSAQLKRGAVANSDIRANAVTSGKVRNLSLRAVDFAPGQLPAGARGATGATGPAGPAGAAGENGSADAFARIDGTTPSPTLQGNVAGFPAQVKGIAAGQVVRGEAGVTVGNYCFNIDGRPSSALVSLDNADTAPADRNLVASVAIDRGEDLGDCPASHNDARVRIVDGNTSAAQDGRFFVWFEK